jgi:hypothetical protein
MLSGHIASIESSNDDISEFQSVVPDTAEFEKYVNIENEFTLSTGSEVTQGFAVE